MLKLKIKYLLLLLFLSGCATSANGPINIVEGKNFDFANSKLVVNGVTSMGRVIELMGDPLTIQKTPDSIVLGYYSMQKRSHFLIGVLSKRETVQWTTYKSEISLKDNIVVNQRHESNRWVE